MENVSVLGQNIKRIRQSKNISSTALAKMADIGVSTISQIETGKRQTLQGATINKIANALNVSVNDLLGENGVVNFETDEFCDIMSILINSKFLKIDGKQMSHEEKILLQTEVTMFLSAIRYQRLKDRE